MRDDLERCWIRTEVVLVRALGSLRFSVERAMQSRPRFAACVETAG
jgi:hypothetical protein